MIPIVLALWLMTGATSAPQGESNDGDVVTAYNFPVALKSFWDPIRVRWQPGFSGNAESQQRPLRETARFCARYARFNPDPNQITPMILDLCSHPSEMRAIFYGIVVVHWEKRRVLHLLWWYSAHGSGSERAAANDFLADMEVFYHADFSTRRDPP
jgi:hypothetical protein